MTTKPGPIAYLTSEYPKFSHTFIQREVAALRADGETIITCATRRPPVEELNGPEEEREYRNTFAIIERAKNPLHLLLDCLTITARRPLGVLGAFGLALRARPAKMRGLLYALFYFAEALVLARFLSRTPTRRIHAHFANPACTVAMLTARVMSAPYSFTIHGPTDFDEPELAIKLARADFIACISHYARNRSAAHLSEDQHGKLHIIHCGVTLTRYSAAPPPEGQALIYVGRLAEVKGAPNLIEAFSRLKPEFPDATLTIVGDGELREPLEADVAARGLTDCVRLTGALSQADVAAELAAASVFCLPSYAEGVPVVLMEAMASGRPVVSSRINGIPELVEEGDSGFLTEPGDVDALTSALRTLIADRSLRMSFGAEGRKRVAADFEITTEARRLRQLFASYDRGDPPSTIRPQPLSDRQASG